jgi:hypothetical protein
MRRPTRREALLMATAATPALAQTAPAASSPEQEIEAARKALARSAEQMAKVDVNAATEPAFVFRA